MFDRWSNDVVTSGKMTTRFKQHLQIQLGGQRFGDWLLLLLLMWHSGQTSLLWIPCSWLTIWRIWLMQTEDAVYNMASPIYATTCSGPIWCDFISQLVLQWLTGLEHPSTNLLRHAQFSGEIFHWGLQKLMTSEENIEVCADNHR